MTASQWVGSVADTWAVLWDKLINFLPLLVGAVLILIIGWLVGWALGLLVDRVLRAISLPALFETVKIEALLKKAEIGVDTTALLAGLVRWIIYIVAFIAAAQVLNLPTVAAFFDQILGYLPQVVAAAAILLIGAVAAHFFEKVVSGSVKAAGLRHATSTGALVRYSVLVFAFLAALAQLGVATPLIQTLFTGFVALLAIAGGLSFGLGGQGLAKELLEKLRKEAK